MHLNGPCLIRLGGRNRFVWHQQHFCPQKGSVLVQFDHLKALAPFGDQVHAPIRILFCDANDLGGAPHLRQALFQGAHHAERSIVRQTLPNHFFVSRLKNVQGQGSAGEQHYVQRKQRKKGHEDSDDQVVAPASCRRSRGHLGLACGNKMHPLQRPRRRRYHGARNQTIVRHRPPGSARPAS